MADGATWTYQLVKVKDGPDDDVLFLSEVYRRADGTPIGYRDAFVSGSTIEECLACLERMKSALEKPILTEEYFNS